MGANQERRVEQMETTMHDQLRRRIGAALDRVIRRIGHEERVALLTLVQHAYEDGPPPQDPAAAEEAWTCFLEAADDCREDLFPVSGLEECITERVEEALRGLR
jgi:hypothetical protein